MITLDLCNPKFLVHQTRWKLDYNQATSWLNHETLIFARKKHFFLVVNRHFRWWNPPFSMLFFHPSGEFGPWNQRADSRRVNRGAAALLCGSNLNPRRAAISHAMDLDVLCHIWYVCVYIYIYLHFYIYMYIYIYIHLIICLFIFISIFIFIFIFILIFTFTIIRIHIHSL